MFVFKMTLARSARTTGIAGAACMALGLFLGGCDSAGSNPTQSEARGPVGATDLQGSSDFDRDLITAKQGSVGSADRAKAIEAVLSRYGVAHTAALQSSEPLPGPVTQAAAAKTAAKASSFAPVVRN